MGKGLETELVSMLIDFGFYGQHLEQLQGASKLDDIDHQCMWEKLGFIQTDEESTQYHYCLTRQAFLERYRVRVAPDQRFELPIGDLQPSQLYISQGKMQLVKQWLDPADKDNFDPIPVKHFQNKILMTDGHTRAVTACLAGWDTIPVYWDTDDLDMDAYGENVKWCIAEGIFSPIDLAKRIVSYGDYQRLWYKRCRNV